MYYDELIGIFDAAYKYRRNTQLKTFRSEREKAARSTSQQNSKVEIPLEKFIVHVGKSHIYKLRLLQPCRCYTFSAHPFNRNTVSRRSRQLFSTCNASPSGTLNAANEHVALLSSLGLDAYLHTRLASVHVSLVC